MRVPDKGDRLNLHNLLFLRGQGGVDLLDDLIGRLLNFPFVPLFVVLADGVLLEELLEDIDPVPAHVADRDPRVLAVFVGDLGHLFASLLVQFGNSDAQNGALDGRTETEIGVPDRLVDRLNHAFVPYGDREGPWLGNTDRG